MDTHCPKLLQQTQTALSSTEDIGLNAIKIPFEFMSKIEKISIDYAIIEKTDQLGCIPTDFSWHDLGNFNELKHVFERNNENFTQSNYHVISSNSSNNVVVTKTRPVVLNNITDLSIIGAEDVLYVSKRMKIMQRLMGLI